MIMNANIAKNRKLEKEHPGIMSFLMRKYLVWGSLSKKKMDSETDQISIAAPAR